MNDAVKRIRKDSTLGSIITAPVIITLTHVLDFDKFFAYLDTVEARLGKLDLSSGPVPFAIVALGILRETASYLYGTWISDEKGNPGLLKAVLWSGQEDKETQPEKQPDGSIKQKTVSTTYYPSLLEIPFALAIMGWDLMKGQTREKASPPPASSSGPRPSSPSSRRPVPPPAAQPSPPAPSAPPAPPPSNPAAVTPPATRPRPTPSAQPASPSSPGEGPRPPAFNPDAEIDDRPPPYNPDAAFTPPPSPNKGPRPPAFNPDFNPDAEEKYPAIRPASPSFSDRENKRNIEGEGLGGPRR